MNILNWDAKTVLAALIFGAYYGLIFTVIMIADLNIERLNVVREMLAVLGPIIGAAAHAVWRNTQADEVRTVANAEVNRTNAETARLAAEKAPPATGQAAEDEHRGDVA